MKSIILSLFLLFIGGCATTTVAPVAGESLQGLRSERIAVSYTLAEKRINYNETLFRLVFLENKSSSQDFSGFWNADTDLSSYLAKRLGEQGFTADSIYQATDKTLIESANAVWSKAIVAASSKTHPTIPSGKLPPATEFFLSPPTEDALRALLTSLREKGYRYLLQLTAMDIYGNAPGYGMVLVSAEPYGRVIDIQSGNVVWVAQLRHGEAYQLGGDLKALETEGMAKAKAGLAAGIGKLDFANLWGLTPAK
jgi:hypothetical protein